MHLFSIGRRSFLRILALAGLSPGLRPGISSASAAQQYKQPAAKPLITVVKDDGIQVFRVPGAAYKQEVDSFVIEFLNHYNVGRPYPIARIFEIFPIQVTERGSAKDLIDRGDLAFKAGSVSNKGAKLDVKFTDQNLGKLSVVFNNEVQAKVVQEGYHSLKIVFDDAHQVPVVFFNLSPQLEIGSNQRLEALQFTQKVASYTLHEAGDPARKVRIDVDLNLKTQKHPTKAAAVAGRVVFLNVSQDNPQEDTRAFVGPFRCDCCGGHAASGTPKSKPIQMYARCCTVYNGQYAGHYDGTPFGRGNESQGYIGKLMTIFGNPFQGSCTNGCEPDPGTEVRGDVTIKISQITTHDNLINNTSCTVIRGPKSE